MRKLHQGRFLHLLIFLLYTVSTSATDATVLQELKKRISPPGSLSWDDPDPCKWEKIQCNKDGRVTVIQIGNQELKGSLPPDMNNLTELQVFDVQFNGFTGSVPSFAGLKSLQRILLNDNEFTSIPEDFFYGMTSLISVYLDNNQFLPWSIPESLKTASSLQTFSAHSANIIGRIPNIFGRDTFPSLVHVHLSFNSLEGPLPSSFAGSSIQSLYLNSQKSRLIGSIAVIQNMTQLTKLKLQDNAFLGPLPDFSGLTKLQGCNLRDNSLTGPVPNSLINLPSLETVNLTNNFFQGPTPKFPSSVQVDMLAGMNTFCLSEPGVPCDSRVNTLLVMAKDVGYPKEFAENWKGNDPCLPWMGITCDGVNITVLNFQNMGLTGTISPNFSSITSLQELILANNFLTGTIPNELALLPNLRVLDVSTNQLHGKIPPFNSNVVVKIEGNVNIEKDYSPALSPAPVTLSGSTSTSAGVLVVVSLVIGVFIVFAGLFSFRLYKIKRRQSDKVQSPPTEVSHPHPSGSDQAEASIMVIPIQVLRNATTNFNEENILGRGGSGTVYKGELNDGTKVAVKRMNSRVTSEKGLDEFKSEIAVRNEVRHRNLVALLGYCVNGNERLLVYEYMQQGTLSRHLFDWKKEGLKPLEWTRRLTIALDVARGVQYLHGLAQQSFIHRDLKPLNILLGEDMRAKVTDFGLVPEGKSSLFTKLAGTIGYLAPEYAATGRITIKIDLFSFGIILMELITGRKALDESQPEEFKHILPWFRKMHINKETLRKAIDPIMNVDEETVTSISTVAELACHCCAREPRQRPDMGHVVTVLSPLAEVWKPEKLDEDEIECGMNLAQALKKWQASGGMSGSIGSSSYL